MSEPVIVIRPHRAWLRIPWREILEYRDLLWVLVRRDVSVRYKQTLLGPVWYVVHPILHAALFTVVFARWARLPTDSVPPPLFYLAGALIWNYFSQGVAATADTFVSNAPLFGKVYFPRLVVPLAKIIAGLFGFAIQAATFAAFWIYFKGFTPAGASFHLGFPLVILPWLLLQTGLLALAVGLWLSALSARYRDLAFVSGFLTQLWMYATPVIWPLSMLSPQAQAWVRLNPMAAVVEAARAGLLGAGTVRPLDAAVSGILTALLLVSGICAFNRTERTFIDTV